MKITTFFATCSLLVLSSAQFNFTECGSTKGCFLPNNCKTMADCEAAVSYSSTGNNTITIELFGKVRPTGGYYVAVGFSSDQKMGDDYVTECSSIGNGQLSGKLSYNIPNTKNNRRVDQSKNILITNSIRSDNGYTYCKIQQQIKPSPSSSNDIPDLSQSFYLLVAMGATDQNGLKYHGTRRFFSANKVAPNTGLSVGQGSTPPVSYFKAHGILMIFAWLCFFPLATLSARLLREHWPEKNPFGLFIWFHLHRILNLLGIICTIIATVFIFVAKQWVWVGPGSGASLSSQLHTAFGIAALVLAWLQPLNALLRPKPQHDRRFIFNWAHRLGGMLAISFGGAAIALAAYNFVGFWNRPLPNLIVTLIPPVSLWLILAITIVGPLANSYDAMIYKPRSMVKLVRFLLWFVFGLLFFAVAIFLATSLGLALGT